MTDNDETTSPDETDVEQTDEEEHAENEAGEGASSAPEPPEEDTTNRYAEAAVDAVHQVGAGLALFAGNIAFFLTRLIPKGKGRILWKKLALASFYNYYKQSGGDAIALNGLPNNHVKMEPVKYLDNATSDGKPGWKSKGRDKVWSTGADGRSVDHFHGKTPVIWTDDDAPEIGGRFQARVGECIDLGQHQPLYQDPHFDVTLNADPTMQGGNGQAIADGGMQVELTSHGVFGQDSIVNIGSPGDSYDGMQISWRKYTDVYPESTTSEEMHRQEERGRIAEMDPDNMNDFAKKMLLIAGGIIVAALAVVFILPGLLGGGGGGSGHGIIPIMLGGL